MVCKPGEATKMDRDPLTWAVKIMCVYNYASTQSEYTVAGNFLILLIDFSFQPARIILF